MEVLGLSILAIKPTPETARALEAETREKLFREADEAIYARRNSAVEQERAIKENELNTEIAVENKKRQIRETQMDAERAVQEKKHLVEKEALAADIGMEDERKKLVALAAENATGRSRRPRLRRRDDHEGAGQRGSEDPAGAGQHQHEAGATDCLRVPGTGWQSREDRATQHFAGFAPRIDDPATREKMNRLTDNKIVLVTRPTRLAELVIRFNTVSQARFYVEHQGADFSDYLREDETYHRALD